MISSLDTYVYNTLKDMLPKVLKDDNLVRQTLTNVDKESRDKFIENFCGDNPVKEINYSYSFPEKKLGSMATLVIQAGPSVKSSSSIGGIESNFTYEEAGLVREHGRVIEEVPEDPSKLKISLEHPIGDLIGVDKISFSLDDDEPYTEGNNIYFNKENNEDLVNLFNGEGGHEHTLTVTYNRKLPKDNNPFGSNIGYTAKESVSITPMSINMDTARCLDIVLHTLLIVMSQSVDEQSTYLLQDFSIGEMQQLAFDFDKSGTQTVYGRPIKVDYHVSNTINYYYEELKSIVFRKFDKEA